MSEEIRPRRIEMWEFFNENVDAAGPRCLGRLADLSAGWHDPVEQKRYMRFAFEEQEPDGSWTRLEVLPPGEWGAMRYLHRFELQLLLQRCGLEIESVWGGYERQPLAADSQAMVFTARRPVRP